MADDSRSEDVEEPTKNGRSKRGPEGSNGEPDVTAHPTPICYVATQLGTNPRAMDSYAGSADGKAGRDTTRAWRL